MKNKVDKQSKKFYCCSSTSKKNRKLSQPHSDVKTKCLISSISKTQYIENQTSIKHINTNISLESDIHLKSLPKENLNSKFDSTAHSNNIPPIHKKHKSISSFNKPKIIQKKQSLKPQSNNIIERKPKRPATHIINSSACIKQIIITPTLQNTNVTNQLNYLNNSIVSISLFNNNNSKKDEQSVLSSKIDNCSLHSNKSKSKIQQSNINISSLSKADKSIISNNVISTNQLMQNKCESSSFNKTIPFNESSSSFIPSDLMKNINVPISVSETEFEISNETNNGVKTVIEAAPLSNNKLLFPKRQQYQSQTNLNCKKLNDKIMKKDKEIKEIKEKITTIINTIHSYEEEDKRNIRFIEKAESEAEMLRYMLNFLLRNNKSRND